MIRDENVSTNEPPMDMNRQRSPSIKKRAWLPWDLYKYAKLIDPPPPFGQSTPAPITEDELHMVLQESNILFPVGFYDMTPIRRGVTKGRGFWRGKEALRLAHCSAEKTGCSFKARFCRIANGMEIYTSGEHNDEAHLTPRKRGLAPAARAVVSKYYDQPQNKIVDWLKDSGLVKGNRGDIEKIKQQVKRRKVTLKRHESRLPVSMPPKNQLVKRDSFSSSKASATTATAKNSEASSDEYEETSSLDSSTPCYSPLDPYDLECDVDPLLHNEPFLSSLLGSVPNHEGVTPGGTPHYSFSSKMKPPENEGDHAVRPLMPSHHSREEYFHIHHLPAKRELFPTRQHGGALEVHTFQMTTTSRGSNYTYLAPQYRSHNCYNYDSV